MYEESISTFWLVDEVCSIWERVKENLRKEKNIEHLIEPNESIICLYEADEMSRIKYICLAL